MTEEASFFPFPCLSTSYNVICLKCFLKPYRKLLLDLLAEAGWERSSFSPKGTEEYKQLAVITEVKT